MPHCEKSLPRFLSEILPSPFDFFKAFLMLESVVHLFLISSVSTKGSKQDTPDSLQVSQTDAVSRLMPQTSHIQCTEVEDDEEDALGMVVDVD